ncbi:putative neuroligin [Thozetella sp. PMI_491]|nr:putative neuroligin [Thozetella sp. PMI_491]
MASLFRILAAALSLLPGAFSLRIRATAPSVVVINGTYEGRHLHEYNQDLFLGIPYPPNSPAWPFTLSEDCLTLNIIRPTECSRSGMKRDGEGLPVGVWIHGGGWSMDYGSNGVYNLSFIVQQSVEIGKPILAVSLDYRLSFWGFASSQEVLDAGVANLGLKDQSLALHWIQENIAAFGGDPAKVTIWGESAAGGAMGYHATAFGGRDDGLFRGIIAESGAESTQIKDLNVSSRAPAFRAVPQAVGCSGAADTLACLCQASFDALNNSIARLASSQGPVWDGDIIADFSSVQLAQGHFTKVPILLGTNADEEPLFGGTTVSSDAAISSYISSSGPDANTTAILMTLYPNIDSLGLPTQYRVPADGFIASQFKRSVAVAGDSFFLSWRRHRTDAWSKWGVPAYSYLFASPLTSCENTFSCPTYGTTHYTEIGYVFYNTLGIGYAEGVSPLSGASQDLLDLAKLTTRMWISLIHDLDPNSHGIDGVEPWPTYNATGGYGQNFYLAPRNAGVRPDTFRLANTAFMNSVALLQYGR